MIHYYLFIIHYTLYIILSLLITLLITVEKRWYNSMLIHTPLLKCRGLRISTVFCKQ